MASSGDDSKNAQRESLIANLSKDIREQCKNMDVSRSDNLDQRGDRTSAFFIPLIATVAKHFVNSQFDKKEKKLEALKKSSTKSYSQTFYTTPNDLKGIDCIAIRRVKESSSVLSPSEDSFLSILKIVRVNGSTNAFYFRPIYLSVKDAVVPTLKDKKALTASIAVSVKTIGEKDNGVRVVDELGSAVLTVGGLILGGEAKCTKTNKCASSQMLPFSNGVEPVSVTVAVTETGSLGIDFDKAIAETQALKEAYGTAIFDGVKAGLED